MVLYIFGTHLVVCVLSSKYFVLIDEANYRMAASLIQIVTCLSLVAQIKCKLIMAYI
jgi:UDP-N-acetylglucosamine transferase subunit ALG13